MWSKQKSEINSSFSEIEDILAKAEKHPITSSSSFKREQLLSEASSLLDELEEKIFLLSTTRTNPIEKKDIENWEESRWELSLKLQRLSRANASTAQHLSPSTPQHLSPSTPQQLNSSTPQQHNPSTPRFTFEAKIGAVLVDRGKEAVSNIHSVIREINSRIVDIEEEVADQRERLVSVRDKVERTQSLLDRSKRAASHFSKLLYQDLVIKALIVIIAVVIVAIFVAGLWLKQYKTKTDLSNMEALNKPLAEEDFSKIIEAEFVRLKPLKNKISRSTYRKSVSLAGKAKLTRGRTIDGRVV